VADSFPSPGTGNIYNNYIRAKLPPGSTTGAVPRDHRASGVAGALGMGQEKSFAIRTFDSFWDFTTPFIGAIIADCWWGRYKTIFVFSLVYLYVEIQFTSLCCIDSLTSSPAPATQSLLVPPLLPLSNTPMLLSVD